MIHFALFFYRNLVTIFPAIVFGLVKLGYDYLQVVALRNHFEGKLHSAANWTVGIAIAYLFLSILSLGIITGKDESFDQWKAKHSRPVQLLAVVFLLVPAVLSVAIIFYALFCSGSWWLFFAFWVSIIFAELFFKQRRKANSEAG